MKYFLIAGEASGDLHASNLVRELHRQDVEAEILGMGGDLMREAGCILVQHYKQMAFMGFKAVFKNLDKVKANFRIAETKLLEQRPDVLILVDYPSFNLKIAKFVKQHLPQTRVVYYISPKIWAWKEYRIRSIKRYVDEMYTIFPFETEFYAGHHYSVTYVGNPLMDAIAQRPNQNQSFEAFCDQHSLPAKPIIAILAGSRSAEIQDCLPTVLQAAAAFTHEYQLVIAGAPSQSPEIYRQYIKGDLPCSVVFDATYDLLQQATVAIVNSGTATLETALIGTPEVVVYQVWAPRLMAFLRRFVLHVPFVSLVNIIARREVVRELILTDFTPVRVRHELHRLLTDTDYTARMRQDFLQLQQSLGGPGAARTAAYHIVNHSKL